MKSGSGDEEIWRRCVGILKCPKEGRKEGRKEGQKGNNEKVASSLSLSDVLV